MTQILRPRIALLAALTGLAALAGASLSAPLSAAPITSQIFDANKKSCAAPIARQERQHGIPSQLLAAVSLAESGRWDKQNSASFAWPWTVTAEGKGQFFASKAEAIAQVQALKARGIRNIDVGCMQINLMYHPNAFPDLETAFEPDSNVAYAAKFLRSQFDETKSWIAAAGNYHSATPEHHFRYRAKITTLWNASRRQSAEERRLEVQTAYQERRAAYAAARDNTLGAARAPLDMSARPPLAGTVLTGATSAPPRANTPPMMAQAGAQPAMAKVPVGQVLPRAAAVPLIRR
ncbi:MAG: transglycosylase SLT domain-containing protein [Alphaproteobacteria bacterium]